MSDKKLLKLVYLRNRDIQTNKKDPITDYALACAVGEVISDIVCFQRDRDLWLIYVDSIESRKLLVFDRFTLHYISVSVFDTNPFSVGTEISESHHQRDSPIR